MLDGDCDSAPLTTMAEVANLLTQGSAQKRRSATAMNQFSTRAHAVIVLSLTQRVHGSATGGEGTGGGGHRAITSKLFLAGQARLLGWFNA